MSRPPKRYREFMQAHPELGIAYEKLGEVARASGPLSPRDVELVKLGVSIGMQQVGAVHAHARKALDAGCTQDELRHAATLAITTIGFPRMMAAYSWIEDVLSGTNAS